MKLEEENKENTLKNKDAMYALTRVKVLCDIFGIWPSRNRIASKIKLGIYLFTQNVPMAIFYKNFRKHGNCGTDDEFINLIVICITSFQVSIKCLIIFFKYEKYRGITDFALDAWTRIIDDESRKIMMEIASVGRILFTCQVIIGFIVSAPVLVADLPGAKEIISELDNSTMIIRSVPLIPNCWASSMSSQIYYLWWLTIAIYSFGMSFATIACNLFIFTNSLSIYSQFRILSLDIGKIYNNKDNNERRKLLDRYIERHDQVLEMANDLESASCVIVLISVLWLIAIGSTSGVFLLLAVHNNNSQLIPAFVARLTLSMVQLYVWSLLGEKLRFGSEMIQDAVYECPWYESPDTVRDLTIIMIRSNRPYHLTAGKLFPINLMTFKEAVKTMFSFFSVMNLMLE